MKKFQLHVPEPCHEDWNEMTPEAQGKFCGACKKSVVDFTGMSDGQVAEFFKKATGSVCGRFHEDQLDRDISIPRKRIPWINYFFQITLPAFLLTMKATAQGKATVSVPSACTQSMGDTIYPSKHPRQVVMGKKNPLKKGRYASRTGQIGSEPLLAKGEAVYEMNESFLNKQANHCLPYPEVLSNEGFLGGAVVVSRKIRVVRKPMPKSSVGLQEKKERTLTAANDKGLSVVPEKIQIYPNPAQAHSIIFVRVDACEAGAYTLYITDASGALLTKETVTIDPKAKYLQHRLTNHEKGACLLLLTNSATGKSHTQQLIVQ